MKSRTVVSLCILCVLCASVVNSRGQRLSTETQRTQSLHRELNSFERVSNRLSSSSQTNDLRFTEISKQAGITFKHVFSPEKKYIAESMSGGVALFDYDNDGYLDIYFVNSLTVDLAKSHQKTKSALYHNNGNNSFTDVTDRRWSRRHWIWDGSRCRRLQQRWALRFLRNLPRDQTTCSKTTAMAPSPM